MKHYMVKVKIEREVKAIDEEEAREKFWIELEKDNIAENTTNDIRLSESMEITEK